MFNSLPYKIDILVAKLRSSSPFYWLTRYKNDLTLFTLLGLPFLALGFIFHFAHVDRLEVEADVQRNTDLTCLARNIYFESRGESVAGQHAVADVTMNRVASKRFPDSVCAVVHEKRWDAIRKRDVGAFSWTELGPLPKPKGKPWKRAMSVAVAAYDDDGINQVPGALFYHAERITPRWSRTKKLVAVIGSHKFYE
jgi:spore germination cell wall hydrolase CwlJ-like protein